MKPLTPTRLRSAWLIALTVDAIQIGLTTTGPLGFFLDVPLDVMTMIVLWRLLGWHWALTPSFVIELLPIADVAPTWTLAVWLITRQRKAQDNIPM